MPRLAALLLLVAGLTACAPTVQQWQVESAALQAARMEPGAVIAADGARLPLTIWASPDEPQAVIIAVHGMNDSRATWHMAGPWWAEHGVTTYAYDQRGFGGAPDRGVWGGEELFVADLKAVVRIVREMHPDVPLALVGESLGAAVIISAMADADAPAADRVILLAPAVWGWSAQPIPNRAALWVAARLLGETAVEPPEFVTERILASDNLVELYRMGRDPAMTLSTRFDAVYGLVDIMETASRRLGEVRAPMAYLYGARDQVITLGPTQRALRNLPEGARTAFYPEGRHLLVRDHGAEAVMQDILTFIHYPAEPWPSGAGSIPLDDR